MTTEKYALKLTESQVGVLYNAVSETLCRKQFFEEDETEINNLKAILTRLGEIDVMIKVNKEHAAFIKKAQNGN